MNDETEVPGGLPGKCVGCGADIPDDAPNGLCPPCLIARGMVTPKLSGVAGGFIAPTAEELDALLPAYHVQELIGQGGMGAVYRAEQTQLERMVAIKVLPVEDEGSDPQFAERFKREAKAMAVSHPNIVTVHDFGETGDGHFYFVMEFVDGTDLHQLIHRGGATPAQALAIVPQICDALQYAHGEGVVHRDVKPGNILIDKKGTVKVTDFGLAKLLGADTSQYSLTATGTAMGTPNYVAPEQMDPDGHPDHRADIYSLGVVFYELLTGQVPKGIFDPPSKKVEVDVRLDEVVIRAMQSEPERRYQQVSEIKSEIEEIQHTPPPKKRNKKTKPAVRVAKMEDPARTGSKRPRPTPMAWATLIVLAAAAVGAVIYFAEPWKQSATLTPGQPTAGGENTTGGPDSGKTIAKGSAGELGEALSAANPLVEKLQISFTSSGDGVKLVLKGNPLLWNIEPLRGLPLTYLDLSGCLQLEDISVLAGMPLEELDLSDTDVVGLTPLEGMPLKKFRIHNAHRELVALAPLSDLPITELDLSVDPYRAGGFYRETSLGGIDKLPLQKLSIRGRDNAAISGDTPYREIDLANTGITDLSGLNATALESIALTPSAIRNGIDVLREAPRLKRIGVWQAPMGAEPEDVVWLAPDEFWKRYDSGEFSKSIADIKRRIEAAIDALKSGNPAQTQWNVAFDATARIIRLDLSGNEALRDVSALRGLPINSLNLDRTNVADLKPLSGMPLWHLNLAGCGDLFDIGPLKGMPLRHLTLQGAEVSDLSPLEECRLEMLHVVGTRVVSFHHLVGNPLRDLQCYSCPASTDVTPLRHLPLRELTIHGNPKLTSLDIFEGMRIKTLSFGSPISEISDLSPLRGTPLERLDCRSSAVTDLSLLAELPLTELRLEYSKITDLNDLKGMDLKRLTINSMPVDDLSPLKEMSLTGLMAHRTNVSDLSPLVGMPLVDLDVSGTRVTDLSPLAQIDTLHSLALDPRSISRGIDELRRSAHLNRFVVGPMAVEPIIPAEEFWKRYDAGEFGSKAEN